MAWMQQRSTRAGSRLVGALLLMGLLAGLAACSNREPGPPPALARIIDDLQDPDELTRQTAATSLELKNRPNELRYSIEALINVLDDPSQMVRFHAYQALHGLTGKDLPHTKKAWDEWWAENKQRFARKNEDMDEMIRHERADLYNNQGLVHLGHGELNAAAAQFKRAIGLNPEDGAYYNNLGLAYYHLGQYENAKNMFDQAIQLRPTLGLAYMNLAQIHEDLRQYDEAIKIYKKAIEVDDQDAQRRGHDTGVNWAAHHRLARAYLKRAVNLDDLSARPRHPVAVRMQELDLMQDDPDAPPDPTLDERDKRYAELAALADDDSNEEVMRLLQDDALLREQKKNTQYIELAIAEAKVAASMASQMPSVHVTLAMSYYAAGRYYQAWTEIQKVYALGYTWRDPDFVERIVNEVKKMDRSFEPPYWVQELRKKRDGSAESNRAKSDMPPGYLRPADYDRKR